MQVTQIWKESSITALGPSFPHGRIISSSMFYLFFCETGSLAHNEMDVSFTHKYIQNTIDQNHPKAFGENDGMVSVNSAIWVCGDQV